MPRFPESNISQHDSAFVLFLYQAPTIDWKEKKNQSLQPALKKYAAWTWCLNRTLRWYKVFDVCRHLHRTLCGYGESIRAALQKARFVMALTTARKCTTNHTPAFDLLTEKHRSRFSSGLRMFQDFPDYFRFEYDMTDKAFICCIVSKPTSSAKCNMEPQI